MQITVLFRRVAVCLPEPLCSGGAGGPPPPEEGYLAGAFFKS